MKNIQHMENIKLQKIIQAIITDNVFFCIDTSRGDIYFSKAKNLYACNMSYEKPCRPDYFPKKSMVLRQPCFHIFVSAYIPSYKILHNLVFMQKSWFGPKSGDDKISKYVQGNIVFIFNSFSITVNGLRNSV